MDPSPKLGLVQARGSSGSRVWWLVLVRSEESKGGVDPSTEVPESREAEATAPYRLGIWIQGPLELHFLC